MKEQKQNICVALRDDLDSSTDFLSRLKTDLNASQSILIKQAKLVERKSKIYSDFCTKKD